MQFTLFVQKDYQNNRVFDPESPLNRDNYLYSFRKLKEEIKQLGHDLNTQDLSPVESSDGTIYIDMPKSPPRSKRSWVILQESEVVRPDNYETSRHGAFEKVFTWKPELVDSKKYIKLNFCHQILEPTNNSYFTDKRLLVLVSGNKMSSHPKQLYSSRKKAILDMEKLLGHEFAYYGPGWERFYLSNTKILKAFRKLRLEFLLPLQKTPGYEGLLKEKILGMNHFRFSLCFENARDIPGYITEKIFDCFFASVVPVYWGAPDIAECIPAECFVDYRSFKSHEELAEFLKNMDQSTFERYLEAAQEFLRSKFVAPFSAEHFARTIVSYVVQGHL